MLQLPNAMRLVVVFLGSPCRLAVVRFVAGQLFLQGFPPWALQHPPVTANPFLSNFFPSFSTVVSGSIWERMDP